MIAALLEAHGVSAGACVSPHAARWSERVLVHGDEIGAAEFAAAVERAAQAADVVNRGLDDGRRGHPVRAGDRRRLRRAGRGPGPGGGGRGGPGGEARRDQHDPLAGHRADLGRPRPHAVAGRDGGGDRRREAGGAARPDHIGARAGQPGGQGAGRTQRPRARRPAPRRPGGPGPKVRLRAAGRFQRRNFALACAAAEAFLGELDPERVASVAAGIEIPGRLERIAERPAGLRRRRPQPARAPRRWPRPCPRSPPRSARSRRRAWRLLAGQGRRYVRRSHALVRALAPLTHVVCTELPRRWHCTPVCGGQSAHRGVWCSGAG